MKFIKIFSLFVLMFGLSTSYIYAFGPKGSQNGKDRPQLQNQINQKNSGVKGGPLESNRPMTMGNVISIDGSNIKIESNYVNPKDTSDNKKIIYIVDSSEAMFYKERNQAKISDIKIGDKLMVEGVITDTKIKATKIHLGSFAGWSLNEKIKNGSPAVLGVVSDVNNGSIVVLNKNNVSYNVDLASSTIKKAGKTISVSDIKKDDNVFVQGEIVDSKINAEYVIVQANNNRNQSFFQKVGNFFGNLFKAKK
jgi:hypothetical protein